MTVMLMLESMGLALIGGVVYVLLKEYQNPDGNLDSNDVQPVRYLSLSVVAGILTFATLGEPSSATAWQFVAAGFGAPAFLKEILVKWWQEKGIAARLRGQ